MMLERANTEQPTTKKNTMNYCPNCATALSESLTQSTCHFCGKPLPGDSTVMPSEVIPSDQHSSTLAWENPGNTSIISVFFRTAWECMMSPAVFFSQLSSVNSLFHAWLYAIAIGSVGTLFSLLWDYTPANFWYLFSKYGFTTELNQIRLQELMFSPLILSIQLICWSVYVHFMLMLTRRKHAPFSMTFLCVCYSQSCAVLNIFPMLGDFLTFFWSLWIIITGTSVIHKITRFQAGIAILFPMILLIGGILFFSIAAMSGSFIVAKIIKDFIPFIR